MTQPDGLAVDVRLPLDRFELEVQFEASQPVTGLFGASGAGKTSLLEVVAGLRRGARGTVRLGDATWLDSERKIFVPPERRSIGYVPQDGLLFPHLDTRHNLLAGARRARQHGQKIEATFDAVVELLELAPLLDRDVRTLSGGERQRVALGRALCSGPRLLLLDEPLAALDMPLRRRLLPFLDRVRKELTVPMLLVSHDPTEVQALCDELIVLQQGQTLARGEPRAVLQDPTVFALAPTQSYENVLAARWLRDEEGTSVVALGRADGPPDSAIELVVPQTTVSQATATRGHRGDELLIGIPANDILIATQPPGGISARNVIAARVVDIRTSPQRALVTADLGTGTPLAVELTASTPAELELTAGKEVFLVIKATSCRIYGAGRNER
ncbi:MAG: molybdenum ABC transporter ATP-binding protein [Acidobacteriota bacterium]